MRNWNNHLQNNDILLKLFGYDDLWYQFKNENWMKIIHIQQSNIHCITNLKKISENIIENVSMDLVISNYNRGTNMKYRC